MTKTTNDGYYAFSYLGDMPTGTDWNSYQGIVSVTYLNAAGEPLAGQAIDGSGAGADGAINGDLPLLDTIPSLRSDEYIG